ncbi:TetR/AcrR family transcriptional regulator, partial [Streptomyces erythrochromogenes]
VEVVLQALTASYPKASADRDVLVIFLHTQCSASEPVVSDSIRTCYAMQVECVRAVSGASDGQIRRFFTDCLFSNVSLAVDAASTDAPWARTLRA